MTDVRDTRSSSLAETLDALRTGEDISGDDAMAIAKAELPAARAEHRATWLAMQSP